MTPAAAATIPCRITSATNSPRPAPIAALIASSRRRALVVAAVTP
jgi:hypothetical protein